MKNVRLAVLVPVVLFASLAVGQTNRWVSDGREVVLKPDDVEIDVVEITDPPPQWGGTSFYPPKAYAKIKTDDGATWIGIDDAGDDGEYIGYFTYRKSLGAIIPTGTTHSRLTFWGSADDSIVSVALFDNLINSVQIFYPPDNGLSHLSRLVRIDMTDADIIAGWEYYDLLVTVKNVQNSYTGLIFYMSVDYSESSEYYYYTWQSGYGVHSLPFRPTSTYDQLIDFFPYALEIYYWDQAGSGWVGLSKTATLTGELADIVRSNSLTILHSDPGARLVRGYPIYEQRFLDMAPGLGESEYRDIGTVKCNIPFDCPTEPDALTSGCITDAWDFDQTSDTYTSIDDLYAFGASPYAVGYRIQCAPSGFEVRGNVDLRCYEPSLLASSPTRQTETTPEELERIIEFKRENGYDIYEMTEASSDTVASCESREERVPVLLEPEPIPYPPGFLLKASTEVPSKDELPVRATPNPFDSTVEISVTVPEGTDNISVTIYNIGGKMIKELTGNDGNTFRWDGTDQKGDNCPTGAYLYRATCGDNTVTDNILYVK